MTIEITSDAQAEILLRGDSVVQVGKTYLVLVTILPQPDNDEDIVVTLSSERDSIRLTDKSVGNWWKEYHAPGILFEIEILGDGVQRLSVDIMYGNKYAGTVKVDFVSWI